MHEHERLTGCGQQRDTAPSVAIASEQRGGEWTNE